MKNETGGDSTSNDPFRWPHFIVAEMWEFYWFRVYVTLSYVTNYIQILAVQRKWIPIENQKPTSSGTLKLKKSPLNTIWTKNPTHRNRFMEAYIKRDLGNDVKWHEFLATFRLTALCLCLNYNVNALCLLHVFWL